MAQLLPGEIAAAMPQTMTAPASQNPGTQFYDPATLAQLQSDAMQQQQRQQLAASLMQGKYVPDSGRAGVLTSILGSVAGAALQSGNNAKITDLLQRQFQAQNQAAQAQHAQTQADAQSAMQRAITQGASIAAAKAQATSMYKKMYAPTQFQQGGTFDPTTGTYTPNADWLNQQLQLKKGDAAIAAANRAPSEISQKVAMLQAMGASPDQIKTSLLGAAAINGTPLPAPDPNAPNGADYIKTLPQTQGAQVQALAEGRMPFPSGTALKSPYWQSMLQQVAQYDPTFDTTNAQARQKTLNSFKGAGTGAQQINALQTFVNHTNLLGQNFQNLDNTSVPALNSVINTVGTATGLKSGVPAYNQNAMNTAMELESLWKKGSGNEADIARAMQNLSSSSSPAQFAAAQKTMVDLANGKLQALRNQYVSGMGPTQNPLQFLDPNTRAVLEKISPGDNFGAEATAPSGAQLGTAAGQAAARAPAPTIPPAAAAMLKANPSTASQFDATFGAGASASILGQ